VYALFPSAPFFALFFPSNAACRGFPPLTAEMFFFLFFFVFLGCFWFFLGRIFFLLSVPPEKETGSFIRRSEPRYPLGRGNVDQSSSSSPSSPTSYFSLSPLAFSLFFRRARARQNSGSVRFAVLWFSLGPFDSPSFPSHRISPPFNPWFAAPPIPTKKRTVPVTEKMKISRNLSPLLVFYLPQS